MKITVNKIDQVAQLLHEMGELEIEVPELTETQKLAIEALAHIPLWRKMGEDEFQAFLKQTMKTQRKLFKHHEDEVIGTVKDKFFPDMSERDERILRENYHLKTSEYNTLGNGMKQIFHLIMKLTPIINNPHDQELRPSS
tara:strand:- start:207 stop:626 length:420 start_codon:yes stop_codon:yes gene_type:complete